MFEMRGGCYCWGKEEKFEVRVYYQQKERKFGGLFIGGKKERV